MRRKNKGIALIYLVLIIALVLAIAFSAIYAVFYYKPKGNEYLTPAGLTIAEVNEKLENNVWDGRIVNDVTQEEVPIPVLYSYVEGNRNAGIIIKSDKLGKRYLFIPYDDKVEYKENEYYKKASNYNEMSSLDLLSMEKYGGFFVELDSQYKMRDLKTINNKNYVKQSKKAKNIKDDNESINSHILSKEEIAQIDNYLGNNNISEKDNIGIAAITIEPFSKVNVSSTKTIKVSSSKKVSSRAKTEQKYYFNYYIPKNGNKYGNSAKIPIPKGFYYCEKDGVVLIQDGFCEDLIYIWVPLNSNELGTIKQDLKEKIYNKVESNDKLTKDSEVIKKIDGSKDKGDKFNKFKKSINKFGGFYVSQAELSYSLNSNGNIDHFMNIARGMVDETVTKTEDKGNYVRGSHSKAVSSNYNRLIEFEDLFDTGLGGVIAHVMFGTEYDAMLLWIAKTNENYTKDDKSIYNIIAQDSSSVGKYQGKMKSSSFANRFPAFNEIWGIGGNLEELTQEIYTDEDKKEHYVTRGGSYLVEGDDYDTAMASRKSVNDDEIGREDVGIRIAYCLDENMIDDKKIDMEEFTYTGIGQGGVKEESDDKNTVQPKTPANVKFEEFKDADENNKRYVCDFNGVTLYGDLNNYTEIKTLEFADLVEITEKATQESTYDNQNVWWVKVKTGDQEGYVNAYKITKDIENIGGADFVISYNGAIRYHMDNTPVFNNYNENSEPIYYTKYVGAVDVIGMSTDSKCVLLSDKNFVPSSYLTKEIDEIVVQTNNKNTIVFMKGPEIEFYATEDTNIQKTPEDGAEVVQSLNKADSVTVIAISKDYNWFKVKKDSNEGYVYVNYFSKEKPAPAESKQVEQDGVKWAELKDTIYVMTTNATVYSKPTKSSSPLGTVTNDGGATPYTRTGWSEEEIEGDHWDRIEWKTETGVIAAYIECKNVSSNKPELPKESFWEKAANRIKEIVKSGNTTDSKWTKLDDTVYINGTDVKVRAQPSISAQELGSLNNDGGKTSYHRIGFSNEQYDGYYWNKIEYNGGIGYIASGTWIVTFKPELPQQSSKELNEIVNKTKKAGEDIIKGFKNIWSRWIIFI